MKNTYFFIIKLGLYLIVLNLLYFKAYRAILNLKKITIRYYLFINFKGLTIISIKD